MEIENLDATYGPYENDHDHPSWDHRLWSRGFLDYRAKEAEDFNHILESHLPKAVQKWGCSVDTGWTFELEEAILEVQNEEFDPTKIQLINVCLPRKCVDPLRLRLRHILGSRLESRQDMRAFAVILLQLIEEAVSTTQAWKSSLAAQSGTAVAADKGWDVKGVERTEAIRNIYENPLGADLDSIDTSGESILGSSIKDVCEQFPHGYRILHVEPVFRSPLVSRFREQRRAMYKEMMEMPYADLRQCVSREKLKLDPELKSKEGLAAELCKPVVSFHGTSRYVVSSIVRHGFVKPGDKIGHGKKLEVRCGASFGIGIYSSPSPEYALWYSDMASEDNEITRADQIPGIRIIVCAVLMGRPLLVTRDETRRTENIAHGMAHSHVSPNRLEYVVFNAAQIIPCYVVHLDMGMEEALRRRKEIPRNPMLFVVRQDKIANKLRDQDIWPAERKAIKDARKAAALKWFPYGFGPATGTRFVIEEIGEISDDEEDYGDYQGERVGGDGGEEEQEWQDSRAEGVSWFDEYQTSRHPGRM